MFSGIKNVQGILLNENIVTEKYITSMLNIYTLNYVLNINTSNCDKTFWSDSYKTLGTPRCKKKINYHKCVVYFQIPGSIPLIYRPVLMYNTIYC